eukprot:s2871_g7.t1
MLPLAHSKPRIFASTKLWLFLGEIGPIGCITAASCRIVRLLIDGEGKPKRAAVKHGGNNLHEYAVDLREWDPQSDAAERRPKCPETCILMWYPCSGEAERQSLHLRVRDLGLQNAVFAELCETDFGKKRGALVSSGVLLVNPPTDMPDLEAKVQEILSCLQDAFHPIFSMESSYLKL